MQGRSRAMSTFVLMMLMAGCTAAPTETTAEEEEPVLSAVPERLSFTAPTFDRDVDEGAQHDLRNSFDGPVLLLWVAAGCSGCHDWTAMLNDELAAGNISNTTNIVSVHRYPAFESINDVRSATTNNSSTHTPWPCSTIGINERDRCGHRSHDRRQPLPSLPKPRVPTLQVLDSEGRLVWTSKTYWANTVLEEALNIMETGGFYMVALIDALFWFSSSHLTVLVDDVVCPHP